ncbi:putative integral membrane protein [Mycobacteroides abscessus subsp. abscessus]|nr:putative integral membrane protein [Mycobacteroides abscessus subsp. abscessus]
MLDAGFWLGFVLVYVATLLLDHFHLLGLGQAYRHYVRQVPDATADRLQVHGPYRLVRHPLMTGLLLSFWCASTLTLGHATAVPAFFPSPLGPAARARLRRARPLGAGLAGGAGRVGGEEST